MPKSIPTEHAVFIEPVAAACEILDQIKIAKGTRVAVLGDGKLGLLIAQVLQAHGAQVLLLGRHREKMRLVEWSGVTTEVLRRQVAGARVSDRGGRDRISGWPARRDRDVRAARNGGDEIDGAWIGAHRYRARDRE